jgi:hypothetical protein
MYVIIAACSNSHAAKFLEYFTQEHCLGAILLRVWRLGTDEFAKSTLPATGSFTKFVPVINSTDHIRFK